MKPDPHNPPERELRRQIKDLLLAGGFLVLYLEENRGYGRPGTPGIPDIVAIRRGVHIWVEVKTKMRGAVRPVQQIIHNQMRAAGATVIVARSTDDILAAIRD